MKINNINDLERDTKLHDYLIKHSGWYRIINRDPNNFKNLVNEYKMFKREENISKAEDMIDNFEMISNIVKMMK